MRVVLFILLAAIPAPAWAQYFGQNKVQYEHFDFQVMRTDHFDIYHYPEEAAAAGHAARLAERWRARLGQVLDHELSGRQPLVLYAGQPHFQQTDVIPGLIGEGTGGVTEFLQRRMVLPFTTSLGQTSHVIGHELVHAFQYDMGRQGSLGLPLWFVEGMAEYLSLGADDPLTAMWLRDAALRETLPDLDELDDPRLFPYRYGHAVWAYLAGRFGEDVVASAFIAATRLRGDALTAIAEITGVDIETLSADWHAAVMRAAEPARNADRRPGRSLFGEVVDDDTLNVSPAISPDGKWVAFLSTRDVFSVDLYVADAETGRIVRRLTKTATSPHFESLQFIASSGAWAPDSRRFAFTALSAGHPTIEIVDMGQDGEMTEYKLEQVDDAWHPSWSPDGARIVFSGLAGGLSDLYVFDVSQGSVRSLTQDAFADFEPAWSPDGSKIAFVTDRFTSDLDRLDFGAYRLGVIDANSGGITPLPAFEQGKHISPQWTRAGDALLLVAEPDGVPNIYRLDLDQRRFERITNVATGISGITALSPPLSFAPAADRMVFTVFHSGGYLIQLLDHPKIDREPLRLTDDASRLPGGNTSGLVDQARARARQLTAAEQKYPVEPYRPDLSLQFVGATGGVGRFGQYGTFANGGVSLLFGDVLNRHQLATTIQASGSLRDIGGQAMYLNREHRWVWGGIGGVIPYVTGAFGQSLQQSSGGPVLVERELIDRQIEADAIGVAQYPFSRALRFEVQAGARHIWFDRELTTRVYSYDTGEQVGENTEDLGSQPSLNLGDTAAALVYDLATFGATAPLVGQRYRFEIGQTVGSLRFSTLTLDYRRYLPVVRPFTFAVRALHVGRYGQASEDPRLSPLFLGYPSLVRGYDVNSFGAAECIATAASDCPVFDQLLGSRLLVGNAELRVPLVGAFTGEYRYGPVPIDAFAFADTGVAWTKDLNPSFADGTREFVTSVGGGIRMNVFGYVIFELAAIRPLDRPGQGWQFGFNLNQGF